MVDGAKGVGLGELGVEGFAGGAGQCRVVVKSDSPIRFGELGDAVEDIGREENAPRLAPIYHQRKMAGGVAGGADNFNAGGNFVAILHKLDEVLEGFLHKFGMRANGTVAAVPKFPFGLSAPVTGVGVH